MGNYQTNNCGYQSENYQSDNGCSACACARNRRSACGLCSYKVIGFFVVALAVALGLIFGAVYAEQIFAALAAVIVFAAVMAVAIIALLIYRICDRC